MPIRVLFFIFFVLFSSQLKSKEIDQVLYYQMDPRLKYQEISTGHFRIIFDSKIAEIASFLTDKIESKREEILKKCACKFDDLTTLVLTNQSDVSDVFTDVFPRNTIYLNVALPRLNLSLLNYTEWYLWVFSHEYTHIVHLNQIQSNAQWLKFIFGSWYRPNQIRPAWLKEGLAVEFESTVNSTGRKSSTYYRMLDRVAVSSGVFRNSDYSGLPSMANFINTEWPWNDRPYQLGSDLVGFLPRSSLDEGKAKSPHDLFLAPSDFIHPVGDDIAKSYGFSGIQQAWDKAKEKIERRVLAEIESIQKENLTEYSKITTSGYLHQSPQLDRSNNLLFVSSDRPTKSSIESLNLNSHRPMQSGTEITRRFGGRQISISKSGRFIAYDQLSKTNRFDTRSDIYILDLKENRYVSVSNNLNAHDPEIHPDGRRIIYIKETLFGNQLCINLNNWTDEQIIYSSPEFQRLSNPRISPDGTKIAFTQHNNKTGGENLLVAVGFEIYNISNDSNTNLFPNWSMDGNRLIFSSDKNGIFNIYEISMDKLVQTRISNVTTGLIEPIEFGDGRKIIAIGYSEKGWDVVQFEKPDEKQKYESIPVWFQKIANESKSEDQKTLHNRISAQIPTDRISTYKERLHFRPDYAYPTLILKPHSLQPGISFGSEEPLWQKMYFVSLKYDTQSRMPVGYAQVIDSFSDQTREYELSKNVSFLPNEMAYLKTSTFATKSYFSMDEVENTKFFHIGFAIENTSDFDSRTVLGPQIGLLVTDELKKFASKDLVDSRKLQLKFKYLIDSNYSKKNFKEVDVQGNFNFTTSENFETQMNISSGQIFDLNQMESYYRLGGRSSFPFSNDSEITLYGYPVNSIKSNSVTVLDMSQRIWTHSFFQNLSDYPIFLGRSHFTFRGEVAFIDQLERSKVRSSFGIEHGFHILLGGVQNLDFKIAYYRGEIEKGGENQFYFLIDSPTQ